MWRSVLVTVDYSTMVICAKEVSADSDFWIDRLSVPIRGG
jgi:hypothetical protein